LQSLNEELLTTNATLDAKVGELATANNDLSNLFSSTDIATIFLDTKFNIKRFTPASTRLMRLIPSDLGRPITDIVTNLIEPDLLAEAKRVLETLSPISREVQDCNGNWYIKRVLPYLTADNEVKGLVFTFSDVTSLKTAQQEIVGTTSKLKEQADLLELAHFLESWGRGVIWLVAR
jgi:two-component system CheB/CheR fusion protein